MIGALVVGRLAPPDGGRRGRTSGPWRLCRSMSDKGATPDERMARIAARQYGVVSIRQLDAVGLDRDAVSYRRRVGRLHRIYRGVYVVGHAGISREGRWMAAVLACGAGKLDKGGAILACWGAAVSHRSAAELWDLLPPGDGPVHILIPGDGGRKQRAGLRLHRSHSLLPAAVTSHKGIPVSTPARTISDLQRSASAKSSTCQISPRELRRAIRQAEILGLPLGPQHAGDRSRSDLERLFLRLCRQHRLPAPEVNVRVGPFLVDFLWRDRRVVVETDGYRYHRGRIAFEDDHDRDLRLRSMGYGVLRVSDRQLAHGPEQVMAILRAELGRQAA